MSAADEKRDYRLPEGGTWGNAYKLAAGVGAVGLALAAFGYVTEPDRFAYSWLFAFFVVLTIALGSMFFVIVQFATAGAWGITTRRMSELLMSGIPVLALLFLPVIPHIDTLYEWTHVGHHEEAGHGDGHEHGDDDGHEHGAGPSESLVGANVAHAQDGHGGDHGDLDPFSIHVHTPYEAANHHRILEHKVAFLNLPFWAGRAIFYFLVWILLSLTYFRWSTAQDESKDKALTRKMQSFAPASIILFGLTLTFAAFDWIMSLEPTWYSTIYGVYVFAGSSIGVLSLTTLILLSLRSHGILGDAVNVDHFHDLGKLLFGFCCFWAYIGFSQLMLLWYAGIPEEATYYHWRFADGGWATVSVLLVLGHFIFPFFFLISRVPKRRLGMLAFGCSWMLVMHVIDIYWFVMPYAQETGQFAPHWMDLACLVGAGGVYLTVVFFQMKRFPLIPLGDPRLPRALHHVQTQ